MRDRNNDVTVALHQVESSPWVSRPLFVDFKEWLKVNLIINDLFNRVGMNDCIRSADLGYVARELTPAVRDNGGEWVRVHHIHHALKSSCPGWGDCWGRTRLRLRKEIMGYWCELIEAADTVKEFDSYGPPSE